MLIGNPLQRWIIKLIMINSIPLPQNCQPISSTNAKQLKQFSWLGRGMAWKIAWCPDGNGLAVASSVGTLLYDTENFDAEPVLLQDPSDGAAEIAFSPNGNILAASSLHSSNLLLWDLTRREPIATLEGSKSVHRLKFSPDGSILVSEPQSQGDGVRFWDMNTLTEKLSFTNIAAGTQGSTAFSSDNSFLSFKINSTLHLWNLREGREETVLEKVKLFTFGRANWVFLVISGDDATATAIAVSELERYGLSPRVFPDHEVIYLSGDPTFPLLACYDPRRTNFEDHVWNLKSIKNIAHLRGINRNSMQNLALSFDERFLAYTSRDSHVRIWDTQLGQEHKVLKGHQWGNVPLVAFHPNKHLLASGSRWDGTIRIWDVNTGKQRAILIGFTSQVRDVNFHPAGNQLLVSCLGDVAETWELRPVRQKFKVWERGNRSTGGAVYSPDGSKFAVGFSRVVNLYATETAKLMRSFRVRKKHRKDDSWRKGTEVAFSPDGTIVAANCEDGIIGLWHSETAEELASLDCAKGSVDSLVFSPDGETLAVGIHSLVQLWNWRTGTLKSELTDRWGHARSTFSPNGELFAFAGMESSVRVWDVVEHREVLVLKGHARLINSIKFSPDGTVLASAADDNTVRLWAIPEGEELKVLPHSLLTSTCVAFSADGTLLATGDYDNVRIWGVARE